MRGWTPWTQWSEKAVLSNTGISGGYHSQWKLFLLQLDFVLVANALSEDSICAAL